jgi:hypothetical protein
MKKIFVLMMLAIPYMVFSGGQNESGRNSSFDTVETGQVANALKIDVNTTINDFSCPYAIDTKEDLSIFVTLEKTKIFKNDTDRFNLLLGLKVNTKEFFKKTARNYIVYIDNPGLLLDKVWREALVSSLVYIRQTQSPNAVFGVFSAAENKIITIPSVESIPAILNDIQKNKKAPSAAAVLDNACQQMGKIGNGLTTKLVWVSDTSFINDSKDSGMFDFFMKLYAQNNMTFSYLGYYEKPIYTTTNTKQIQKKERQRYGTIPNWALMNTALKSAGGSSYYTETAKELSETILDDYDRFVRAAVENIRVKVSLMPWILTDYVDYRSEWYPVNNFRSQYGNRISLGQFELKNMEYDEHKTYLYYLVMRPDVQFRLAENKMDTDNNVLPVGTCSVEYYSYTQGKTVYKTYPLNIDYTDDYGAYKAGINDTVVKYTILQNTAFILQELNGFLQTSNYYNAILLLDAQIRNLKKYQGIQADAMISDDIETLQENKNLIMYQARKSIYF